MFWLSSKMWHRLLILQRHCHLRSIHVCILANMTMMMMILMMDDDDYYLRMIYSELHSCQNQLHKPLQSEKEENIISGTTKIFIQGWIFFSWGDANVIFLSFDPMLRFGYLTTGLAGITTSSSHKSNAERKICCGKKTENAFPLQFVMREFCIYADD